jgi:hypothetical protein
LLKTIAVSLSLLLQLDIKRSIALVSFIQPAELVLSYNFLLSAEEKLKREERKEKTVSYEDLSPGRNLPCRGQTNKRKTSRAARDYRERDQIWSNFSSALIHYAISSTSFDTVPIVKRESERVHRRPKHRAQKKNRHHPGSVI